MKIVRDVPGERLTLEGAWVRTFPTVLLAVLGLLIVLIGFGPLGMVFDVVRRGSFEAGDLVGIVLAGLFTAFVLAVLVMPRITYRPFRLDVDRTAGEVRFVEKRTVGKAERVRVVPLDRLRGLTVQTVSAAVAGSSFDDPDPSTSRALLLVFQVARDESGTRLDTRPMRLRVDDLDKAEEVMDFAYRLGAASGLVFAKVVRNDPRTVEVALSPTREAGFATAPWNMARADYARDVVAPAARDAAAREVVPPFEPKAFPSNHRVAVYEPGRLVVLKKPLGFAAVGCLPFTLFLLAGPGAFVALGYSPGGTPLAARLVASLFALVFGGIIGGIALALVFAALPRTVTLDWETGRVTTTGKPKVDLALADVKAVELRRVHRVHRSKNSTSHSYYCVLLLVRRARSSAAGGVDAGAVEIVETTHLKEPDTPYEGALPLATELAKALRVERRITED